MCTKPWVAARRCAHWDSEFPHSTRILAERTDLTAENKRNILGENAGRFYPALARVGVRS